MTPADRRQFLTGAGIAAAACCGLAGCTKSTDAGSPNTTAAGTTAQDPTTAASTPATSAPTSGSASAPTTSAAAPTGPSVPVADVPVGGGSVLTDSHVVVVQPESGTYKGYTSICTHQGCDVSRVENNEIHCDCHGSVFSALDGSVTTGPATSPLAGKTVTVSGDTVVIEA